MQTNNNFRIPNKTDEFVDFLDTTLRTLFGHPITTTRQIPHKLNNKTKLTIAEQKKSAGLMRVNHCGEVCAQALYQGQALTTRDPLIKAKFKQAALEENDHLAWCQARLSSLESRPSYLNPLWYLGSLTIGITAGLAGDKWNLGFLAETEKQVSTHLGKHLEKLPSNDHESIEVVTQMKLDEEKHAVSAIEAGAHKLPTSIKYTMQLSSKIMTTIAYYI